MHMLISKKQKRIQLLIVLVFLNAFLGIFQVVQAIEFVPWGVDRIGARCVWDKNPRDEAVDDGANAGGGVTIAVIDTGVYYWVDGQRVKHYHPDLADNIVGGRGFIFNGVTVNEVADYSDSDGHGTHVIGTIAAVDNDDGVIGVAPRAKIYALKIYSMDYLQNKMYAANETAAAIRWAVDNGCNIISMSLGFETSYPALSDAVVYACDNNRILIAAAGDNESRTEVDYPAHYGCVIAVGSVDENDNRAISNSGEDLDYMAPAVDIYSTDINDGYANMSDSSTAVPHVTGAAALIVIAYPGLQWWEVNERINETALDLGDPGFDNLTGHGLVNAWYSSQNPSGNLNNDSRVNICDIVTIALAFSSTPSDPNWNPVADITIDRLININDIVIVALHFGEVN